MASTFKELSQELKSRNISKDTSRASRRVNAFQLWEGSKLGLDTLETDLRNMGETIGGIYGGWQTQETMQNTRKEVESMHQRLSAFQDYQSKYAPEGGVDLSDLMSGYQSVLDDWDNLTSVYGYYQNAGAFNTAKKKAEMDEQFSGLSYDEVQKQLKNYKVGSDEYKYLSEYTNYSNLNDFDKALESLTEDSDYKDQLQAARNQYAIDNTFDLYKNYMSAEDFEERSQYVANGNEVYEYINDVDGTREDIEAQYEKAQKIRDLFSGFGTSPIKMIPSMQEKGYDRLKPEEKLVYNYLYDLDKEQGTNLAQEFLDDMEITLTKRNYDDLTKELKESADGGVGESVLLSVVSVPANLIGAVYSTIDSIGDVIQGKEYNPYGYYKMPSNFASDARKYVGENIAEETEGMELFGQNIPQFLYQTGMSAADSAAGAMSFGSAFSPIMGASAFQQRAKELKEEGASNEQILSGATASGLLEMVFEKYSIDNLIKAKGVDSIGVILKETAKQAGIEGSEEIATEVGNILYDTIARGTLSDAYKKYEEFLSRGFSEEESKKQVAAYYGEQIAWAGIGGALSGTALGNVSAVGQYAGNRNTGKQIRANDRVQEMMDMYELMELQGLTPEQSEAYRLYGEYANKGVNAETISNAKLGNLYRTSVREAGETLSSKDSTAAQKTDARKRLDKLAEVATSKPVDERARQKRVEELNKGEVTEVTATGNSAKIEGIRIEDGATTVLTSVGEVKADDMTFSANDAEILSYAEIMGEEKGNLLLSQYDGKTDVPDYVNSFNMAYAYGETGFNADSVLANKGVLTDKQASEIYKAAVVQKAAARQKAIDAINAKYSKNITVPGTFDDSIIDYDSKTKDGSKVNWKSLTSRQRSAITFAKSFSKAAGVNIKFIQSDVVKGKRVGKNGSYDPANNTIEIDVYAGIMDAKAVNDAIIPTLSHELTHWMKAKAPAMYANMREHIGETLALEGTSLEARIDAEIARMKLQHPDTKVTPEMAVDEIVARACEDMLSNSEKARELLNALSESERRSFVDHVKEVFQNLMEWVNDLLGQYKSNSAEAEFLRQYGDRVKELSKMWDQALEEAVQTNQSMQAGGVTGEKVLKENKTQFSDRMSLEEQINKSVAGELENRQTIYFGNTSKKLQDVGLDSLPILYTQRHLRDALAPKNEEKHQHGIKKEQILRIPDYFESPVMILDSLSRKDSVVVVTDMLDPDGLPIIASIKPNGEGYFDAEVVPSNFMTSVYGRNEFVDFIQRAIDNDAVLYTDKAKSQKLYRQLRVQFPQGLTTLGFDTIIHKSRNVVKGKNLQEQYSDRAARYKTDNYYSKITPASRKDAEKMNMLDERNIARYRKEIDGVFDGSLPSGRDIMIGMPSKVLLEHGVSNNAIHITQSVVRKIVYPLGYKVGETIINQDANRKTQGNMDGKHNLGISAMKNIPLQIADPIAITKNNVANASKNSIVLWTNWITEDGKGIMLGLVIDSEGATGTQNNISTVFQADENYAKQFFANEENILYTKNKEDINQLLSLRRYMPEARVDDTFIKNLTQKFPGVKYSDRNLTRSEANKLARQRVSSYKEQIEKKAKIESITQKALVLNRWMVKPSNKEHIHKAMEPVVKHLLKAIDFSSKQLLGMRGGQYKGMPTQKDISLAQALADVQQMISEAKIDGEVVLELYGADLDNDMAELLKSVNLYARTVGDNAYVLNQMTLDELHKLDKMVGAIKASVTKMNKFHVVNSKKGIVHTAQQDIRSMNELGQIKLHKSNLMKGVHQMINWGNINPYFAFKRFGEGGKKVFEALQDGWDTFAFHVKKIIDYAKATYSSEDVKMWSKELHEFDVLLPATKEEKANPNFKGNHQKIQMTTAQIMSLYCLQKREQAGGHLFGGGIGIADIETKKDVIAQNFTVMLTESELNRIINSLTEEQIAVAEKLQKFMNEDCKDWGNEISMKRFGYKAMVEENYFPIKSDPRVLKDKKDTPNEREKSLYRLLNMSFTKSLTEKANNRILVENIFDVFAQHASEMAKYNALALPVLDAVRWFGYTEKGQKMADGQYETFGVKQSMINAFGNDSVNYVTTFLEDINGADNVGRDSIAKGFFSNAKIASVGFNLKVAALQPTSYLRASAVIDPKYLAKVSASPDKVKYGIEMAEKWCGMALWKSLGFYDTNIQRGVAELIKHDNTWKDKVTEASMKGAEKMDQITWGCLWNACEAEVKATRNDLSAGSDEYYTAVGKRLREVIYTTQVVDSTMTRSHMMRSSDGKDKMLTMFASEPTLAYNMLMDVFYDWKLTERKSGKSEAFAKHKTKMVRVALAYTVTNLVTSLLETAFEAYRDDDEDEEELADYVISYLQSFGSNMAVSTKIPYLKDLVSILQGFTSNRTDTQWVQNLVYASKDWMKIFGGEGNVYKALYRTLSTISQVSGIAMSNVMRELASFWHLSGILRSAMFFHH